VSTGRRARAAAAATLAVVLAACGVQLDEGPREVAVESVPYGLLDPSTTTTSEPPRLPDFQETTVYLLDTNDLLRAVKRNLPGEPTVEGAVQSLLTPPSEAEGNSGLGTAIASNTVLRGPVQGPVDGVVTIDLSSEINEVAPQGVRRALAQIVYTATSVPGVTAVLFQVDGEARSVPNAAGESTSAPLTREDYREFLPTATTTTRPDDVPDT
jgi:spore germination protein GerM